MSQERFNCTMCRSENVQIYFDGGASVSEGLDFARHLENCEVCEKELQALRRIRSLLFLAIGNEHAFVPVSG